MYIKSCTTEDLCSFVLHFELSRSAFIQLRKTFSSSLRHPVTVDMRRNMWLSGTDYRWWLNQIHYWTISVLSPLSLCAFGHLCCPVCILLCLNKSIITKRQFVSICDVLWVGTFMCIHVHTCIEYYIVNNLSFTLYLSNLGLTTYSAEPLFKYVLNVLCVC